MVKKKTHVVRVYQQASTVSRNTTTKSKYDEWYFATKAEALAKLDSIDSKHKEYYVLENRHEVSKL